MAKIFKKKVKKEESEEEVKAPAPRTSGGVEPWTGSENPVDGSLVNLGDVVYRFKDVMKQPFDVQIGADAAESLENLRKAVNQNGESGKHYFEGTRGQSLVPLEITL